MSSSPPSALRPSDSRGEEVDEVTFASGEDAGYSSETYTSSVGSPVSSVESSPAVVHDDATLQSRPKPRKQRLLAPSSDDERQSFSSPAENEALMRGVAASLVSDGSFRRRGSRSVRNSQRMSASVMDASVLLRQDYRTFVEKMRVARRQRDLRILGTLLIAFALSALIFVLFPRLPTLKITGLHYQNFTYNIIATVFEFAIQFNASFYVHNGNFYKIGLSNVNLTITSYDLYLGYLFVPDEAVSLPFHDSDQQSVTGTISLYVPVECFADPDLQEPLESLATDLLRGYIKATLSGRPTARVLGMNITLSINELLVIEPFRYLFNLYQTPSGNNSTPLGLASAAGLPSKDSLHKMLTAPFSPFAEGSASGSGSSGSGFGSGSGSMVWADCPQLVDQ